MLAMLADQHVEISDRLSAGVHLDWSYWSGSPVNVAHAALATVPDDVLLATPAELGSTAVVHVPLPNLTSQTSCVCQDRDK
jgi:hypothetical protein